MRITADDGCELEVTVTGEGPAIVLNHGGPGLWDYLEELDDFLPGHTVIRYDQRGCGRSDRTQPWSYPRLLADLENLREELGLDRWVVGGHSFGAGLALRYAVEHPERTTAVLYLAGTGIDWPTWRDAYKAREAKARNTTTTKRIAELEGGDRSSEEELEYLALRWMTDYKDQALGRARSEAMARAAHDAGITVNYELNKVLNADQTPIDLDALSALDRNVLIVQGDRDVRPVASCDELVELLPRATRIVMDKAGHYPWAERPDMFRIVMAGFLAGLDAVGG